ncbi:MAG: nucleotidyltransferase domain-containing protein [Planctomycetes bacterium]|nr:nucleotidyltransferase domain-containing protein [Planctomycetota bacterium]
MRHLKTLNNQGPLSPDDIDRLGAALPDVCRAHPIVLLYIHGAHAQGRQGPLSDIDIAILLDAGAGDDHRVYLEILSSLQSATGREDVDLAVLNRTGPALKARVIRQGRLVYARSERERVDFESRTTLEALDFEHYSRIYDEALFHNLSEGASGDGS